MKRGIGLFTLTALIVNSMVGAGVLGLPGKVAALAGSNVRIALGVAAFLALAVALCLAELASRYEKTGGPVLYIGDAFGPLGGFLAGWLLWAGTVLSAASLLNLMITYAGAAPSGAGLSHALAITAAAIGLTVVTLCGVRQSAWTSALMALGKLILLMSIAIFGLLVASPAPAALQAPKTLDIAAAIVLLFFAFVGFERPTALGGEISRPRLILPIALLAGVALVCTLYFAVFAACLRSVPNLPTNGQPIAALAQAASGAGGGFIVEGGTILVLLGTLSTQWLTAPRLLFAMAQTGDLPAILARVGRRQTPDIAILVTGAGVLVAALSGSFTSLLAASSAARLIIFAMCAGALLRSPTIDTCVPNCCRRMGVRLLAALTILICIGTVFAGAFEQLLQNVALCIPGVTARFLFKARQTIKARGAAESAK